MLFDGALTFREFAMHESVPLAVVHRAVLEFLRDRDDAALFGAQAVNAYVDQPRMTQDVDILSPRAHALAQNLRDHLHGELAIAVRIREVKDGLGYRIYQIAKPKNRHLVDVRQVDTLPPTERIERVLVLAPADLVATKVIAYATRRGKPKAFLDRRDLAVLLLAFPELREEEGEVATRLKEAQADASLLAVWHELLAEEIVPPEEDDDF
jgi:hypothetical protein